MRANAMLESCDKPGTAKLVHQLATDVLRLVEITLLEDGCRSIELGPVELSSVVSGHLVSLPMVAYAERCFEDFEDLRKGRRGKEGGKARLTLARLTSPHFTSLHLPRRTCDDDP